MEPGPVSDLTQHLATRAPDLCSCWSSVVSAIGKNGQAAEGWHCRTCWQALSRIVPSDCSEMSRRTHERAVSYSTACRTTPCNAKGACPCAATDERVSLSGHCVERCPLHARSCYSCLYRTCNLQFVHESIAFSTDLTSTCLFSLGVLFTHAGIPTSCRRMNLITIHIMALGTAMAEVVMGVHHHRRTTSARKPRRSRTRSGGHSSHRLSTTCSGEVAQSPRSRASTTATTQTLVTLRARAAKLLCECYYRDPIAQWNPVLRFC
jgi:hypothetical protein